MIGQPAGAVHHSVAGADDHSCSRGQHGVHGLRLVADPHDVRDADTNPSPGAHPTSRRAPEAGFTLIEVMVVVLIIGILLAFAVPTFLGARNRASDAEASSSLRTALTAAVTTSDIRSDFRRAASSELATYEPSLSYVDATTPSESPGTVSVDASAADRWVGVVQSDSGTCFAVVAGPYGQTRSESNSCAAANVTLAPPDLVRSTPVHAGSVTATTQGMCLEVVNGLLEQRPCDPSQPTLTIETRNDGYSTLSLLPGSCFGTTSPTKHARIADEVCDGADNQLWLLVPAVNGTVQFKNKETGYCLDVNGNSTQAGAALIQWGFGDPPDATCKPTTTPNNHNFGLG